MPEEDDYMVYTYNRFQACRFGLEAVYVDPPTGEHLPLREHILHTLERVAPHARRLEALAAIELLRECAERSANDARWLRDTQRRERLLSETVRQAAVRFRA
jgi:carboxylate-amine ligase